jgi:two-component system, NarL family, nitrate/nitrite response regulator NarL
MVHEAAAYQGVGVAIRILVVDDSHQFRRGVCQLLMLRGFEVVDAVADGEEALAAVIDACPDGVLLDVNLPGRDGYAVAASLVAVCPATRVVLTSSDVDGVSTAVLDDCGATAFVPKTELATVDLRRLFSGGDYGRLDERETAGPSGT